jgi:hypothetical protein
MTQQDSDYYRRRELQERAAAKYAQSASARRIHQQLAERYAASLSGYVFADPLASLRDLAAG